MEKEIANHVEKENKWGKRDRSTLSIHSPTSVKNELSQHVASVHALLRANSPKTVHPNAPFAKH